MIAAISTCGEYSKRTNLQLKSASELNMPKDTYTKKNQELMMIREYDWSTRSNLADFNETLTARELTGGTAWVLLLLKSTGAYK